MRSASSRRGPVSATATRTSIARWSSQLAELGFFGMLIPERYDGLGLDAQSYLLALEEIAVADASAAVLLSVHNSLPTQMILNFGGEAQQSAVPAGRWRVARRWAPSRCPSPRPAPTRRRCAARRCATATTGCSTGRRRGCRMAARPA